MKREIRTVLFTTVLLLSVAIGCHKKRNVSAETREFVAACQVAAQNHLVLVVTRQWDIDGVTLPKCRMYFAASGSIHPKTGETVAIGGELLRELRDTDAVIPDAIPDPPRSSR